MRTAVKIYTLIVSIFLIFFYGYFLFKAYIKTLLTHKRIHNVLVENIFFNLMKLNT